MPCRSLSQLTIYIHCCYTLILNISYSSISMAAVHINLAICLKINLISLATSHDYVIIYVVKAYKIF